MKLVLGFLEWVLRLGRNKRGFTITFIDSLLNEKKIQKKDVKSQVKLVFLNNF